MILFNLSSINPISAMFLYTHEITVTAFFNELIYQ